MKNYSISLLIVLTLLIGGCSDSTLNVQTDLKTIRLQLPKVEDREFPELHEEYEKHFAQQTRIAIDKAKKYKEKYYIPPHQEALQAMGYDFPSGCRFIIDNRTNTFIITNTNQEIKKIVSDFSMKELPY